MTQLEAALIELTSVLDELRTPYALIGGLAVSMWGEPRATLDIDLVLWVEPERVETVLAALCKKMRPLPEDPAGFVRQTRVLPAVTSVGVRADVIFGALPPEQDLVRRARPRQLGERTVMVASVEDLVVMKLVSERERDQEDARRLLRRFRKSLDRPYLEPRLKELAEALARPGILNVFLSELGE